MTLSLDLNKKEIKKPTKGFKLDATKKPATNRVHDILFGTGLTKKLVKKQEKQQEIQQAIISHLVKDTPTCTITELRLNLPSTLVDDEIILDDSQIIARDGILNNKFACLIGAAGTGKTTTLKHVIYALLAQNSGTIAICAYTGRAVQQIKRALPETFHDHCDTIHGLLEFAPEYVEKQNDKGEWELSRQFIPHRTKFNPLSQEIIIVDEGGMLSIDLWHKLLVATKNNTRIYIIGDINQLPPVHGRSVLGFAMKKWPTFALNRIHRTEESAIIDGAWNILQGRMPESHEGKVLLKNISDNSIDAFKQVVCVIQKLANNNAFNPLTDGIITPQNEGTLGQTTFNDRLCAYFNQPKKDADGIILNPRTMVTSGSSHHAWAVGDKIMATKNDREEGITNGMVGVIEAIIPNEKFRGDSIDDMAVKFAQSNIELNLDEIDEILPTIEGEIEEEDKERQSSHIITIKFQNLEQSIQFTQSGIVNTLMPAYAFTCHKAQGGEYPVVVIVCHSANFRMLCREWLYTAWTRAQEKVILLYNSRGLQMALNNQRVKGNSIQEKADSFNKLQERNAAGEDGIIIPQLPEPEEINHVESIKTHIFNKKPITL